MKTGSVGRAGATVVWRDAGLRQTIGWLLGSPAMTLGRRRALMELRGWVSSSAIAPALGLRRCGSRRDLRGFLILFRKYIFFN
jgi:hypothetical protein